MTAALWQNTKSVRFAAAICDTLTAFFPQGRNMPSTDNRLSKATILGMFAMGVAVLVVANDFTALSVALPAIEHDLHTDVSTVQWVINGYAMVFGVSSSPEGAWPTCSVDGVCSSPGALTVRRLLPNRRFCTQRGPMLLACRFLDGYWRSLDVARDSRHDLLFAAARRKPGWPAALILGAAGFGNAVGPLLGGLLTDHCGLALDLLRQPSRRCSSRTHHDGCGGP